MIKKSKLSFIKPKLEKLDECILVGSSASVLNNHKINIDSYKNIFRFNRAPTKGFEESVGSKTDYRVVNNHVFENRKKWLNSEDYSNQDFELIKNLKNTNIIMIGTKQRSHKHHKKNFTKNNNKVYTFDYTKIEKLKQNVDFKSSKNMSIGTIIISILLVGESKINLIGFDTEYIDTTHYWESRPKAMSVRHDQKYEKEWLRNVISSYKNINVLI